MSAAASILIIEDNLANLELMTYLLRSFYYSAFTASDGASGLTLARTRSPDLIVCDIQLPVLDGFAVARELKLDPVLRTVPLVAVTAYAMVGDRDRMLAAGFDGYIAKPIAPETFVSQLEEYLLPAKRAALRPTPATCELAAESQPATSRGKVLLIDDLAANLELLQGLLIPLGYTTLACSSPADALALARRERPDLIITDIHLGLESGLALLQSVRADPILQSIPVALISASSPGRSRSRIPKGATANLTWDQEPAELVRAIGACIALQAPGGGG
jgi:two-component system cell cycle response regulator